MMACTIDGLMYCVLKNTFADDSRAIIAESFADEPTSVHLSSNRQDRFNQWMQYTSLFYLECSSNGLSIACIDTASNTLAGVLWVQDFKQPPTDEAACESLVATLSCINPVKSIIQPMEDKYISQRPQITSLGQCANLMLLGVHPSYRRRGIANHLTSFACQHLKQIGYKYIILESSGAYSAKCAEAVGMNVVMSRVYSECNELFLGIPEEHNCMRLWELITDQAHV